MKLEERWFAACHRLVARVPVWPKAIVVALMPLSLLFVAGDDLRKNVPDWLALVLLIPYIVALIWIVPAVAAVQLRWLSWPVRAVMNLHGQRRRGSNG